MDNKILIFALLTVLFIGLSSSFVSADCGGNIWVEKGSGMEIGARAAYFPSDSYNANTVFDADTNSELEYLLKYKNTYLYNPSGSYNGFSTSYSCESFGLAGVYIYGDPSSLSIKIHTGGERRGWWPFKLTHLLYNGHSFDTRYRLEKTAAAVSAQVYTLFDGYSVDKYSTLLSDSSGSNFLNNLFDEPTSSSPFYLYSYDGDTVVDSKYVSGGYGAYYLGLAYGIQTFNLPSESDYFSFEYDLSGDVYISTDFLTVSEMRSEIPDAMLEKSKALCGLVGEHVQEYSYSTESGKIKCCGARTGDNGEFNYQYRCDYSGGEYFWTNICSNSTPYTSGSKNEQKYNLYCGCEDSSNSGGYCTGSLDLTCDSSDTIYCSGLSDDPSTCTAAGCNFDPSMSCGCHGADCDYGEIWITVYNPDGFGSSGCYDVMENPFNTGSFFCGDHYCEYGGYPEIVIDYTDGTCSAPSGSYVNCKSYWSDQTCIDMGCRLKDGAGNTYNYDVDTCYGSYSLKSNKPECLSAGCTWNCKSSFGPCDTTIDCLSGSYCSDSFDPFEEGERVCHPTSDLCAVGPYDGYVEGVPDTTFTINDHKEVADNKYVCSEGVYKQCDVHYEDFSGGYCTSSSEEFECTGTPNPQVCKSSTLYCSSEWADGPRTESSCENIHSNCHYSPGQCFDPDGDSGDGGAAYSGIFNDVSIPLTSGFLPEGSCDGMNTQEVCEGVGCTWLPASCYGTYTKSCSGTPPCDSWCYASPSFTSCAGRTYSQCTDGCTRSCEVPTFTDAISPEDVSKPQTVRENACACEGKQFDYCYKDNDGDGLPIASGATYLCFDDETIEAPYGGYTFTDTSDQRWICDYSGDFDCNDDDASEPRNYYLDGDADGFGDSSSEVFDCYVDGYVIEGGDCDDGDPCLYPSHEWVYDGDLDGHVVNLSDITLSCTRPDDYQITDDSDCSDESFYFNPMSDGDCDDGDASKYRLANVCPDLDSDGHYDCAACQTDVCVGDFMSSGYAEMTQAECEALGESDCDDNNSTIYRLANVCPDLDSDGHYDCDSCLTDVCANNDVPTSHTNYVEWTETECLADGEPDCDDSADDRWRISTVHVDVDGDGYYNCADPLSDQCIGCDDPMDGFCNDSYMPEHSSGEVYTDDYASTCTYDNAISDCNDNDDLLYHLCCDNPNSYEFEKSGASYTYDADAENTIFFKVRMDNYDPAWPDGEPRVDGNDWPFGSSDWSLDVYSSDAKTLFDNSLYGCAATTTASVYYDDFDAEVKVVESNAGANLLSHDGLTAKRVTRSTTDNCDDFGCPWVDCDNNKASATQCGYPFLIEGKFLPSAWTSLSQANPYNPDDSAERGFGGYTDYDGPNYDVRQTRNESCGDDIMEHSSIGFCEASTDYRQLCCVSPDMYNMDGVCVFYDQCPDVMKSAPVWVDGLSQAEYNSYVAILSASGEGYCCDYNYGDIIPLEKNLCNEGEKGCYIKTASLIETQIPKPGYVQNNHDCPAGSCALELCSSATNYSLCEKSTTCESDVYKLYVPGITNLKECRPSNGGLTISVQEVASYPSMEPGCDESSCERVTETICTLDTASNSCYALCNDDISDCELVCAQSDYTCEEVETLRNCEDSSCVYDNSNPVVSYRYSVDTSQSFTCEDDYFTECNEFGCAPPKYCGGNPPDGTLEYFTNCDPYPPLHTHTVTCGEHLSCAEHDCNSSQALNSADNLVCLPEVSGALDVDGNNYPKLAMNDEFDTLQCSPDITIGFKGQPFCPEGFEYDAGKKRCQVPLTEGTANCDYGYRGSLTTGCDNLLQGNDPYAMYTSGCFKDSDGLNIDSVDDLNAQACCLDYSIVSGSDIYDVYTIEEGEEYIRIY